MLVDYLGLFLSCLSVSYRCFFFFNCKNISSNMLFLRQKIQKKEMWLFVCIKFMQWLQGAKYIWTLETEIWKLQEVVVVESSDEMKNHPNLLKTLHVETSSQVQHPEAENLELYFLCFSSPLLNEILLYFTINTKLVFLSQSNTIFSNIIVMRSVKMTVSTRIILHFFLFLVLAFLNWCASFPPGQF